MTPGARKGAGTSQAATRLFKKCHYEKSHWISNSVRL